MRPKARPVPLIEVIGAVEAGAGEALLLRVPEVCRMLGVGRSTVYDLIARGDLPAIRIGRLVRVPRPALEDWIAANTTGVDRGEAA